MPNNKVKPCFHINNESRFTNNVDISSADLLQNVVQSQKFKPQIKVHMESELKVQGHKLKV